MNSTTAAPVSPACETSWLYASEHRLFRIERAICILALIVMLVTVTVAVFVRYFNLPVPNVAEWALVAMSPLTFVGAAMCSYAQAHIAVDVVKLVPSAHFRRAIRGAVAICMLAFSGVYAWLAWLFFRDMAHSGEKLLDMGTPVAVPGFFLVIGMTLMVFHSAIELWRVIMNQAPVNEEML
jgi:TRAP-type C4-dicarboxylate transport system permease small subunit